MARRGCENAHIPRRLEPASAPQKIVFSKLRQTAIPKRLSFKPEVAAVLGVSSYLDTNEVVTERSPMSLFCKHKATQWLPDMPVAILPNLITVAPSNI
jgi:hypothetical protein